MRFLWVLFLMSSLGFADVVKPQADLNLKAVSKIAIQTGGRIKPFDTFARETVLFLTGTKNFKGYDPVELMLSWLALPEKWQDEGVFQISNLNAKRQLGVDPERKHFSYSELLGQSHLRQYLPGLSDPAGASKQSMPISKAASKADARDQELKNLVGRMGLFQSLVSGQAWVIVPSDRTEGWLSLAEAGQKASEGSKAFGEMILAYKNGDRATFEAKAVEAQQKLILENKLWTSTQDSHLNWEYLFNHAHPFQWAWAFYLIGMILFLLKFQRSAWILTAAAFTLHVGGFILRMIISGRPPVTNMYESVIWVAFGVVVFAAILYQRVRQNILMIVGTAVCALCLIVADLAPAVMDPSIQPLVPVLRSNFWLTIHVLTITLGYAAFALTLGIGNVAMFQFLKPGHEKKVVELNHLSYRAMQFGVFLLAAGTILGGVWADYSWGRFWGWDPKEVWALIALLGYTALLHARYTGWIQQFGFSIITVLCFLGVLMAWYGVNFVLGVGLHSYGFSTGGRGSVAFFVIIQLLYLAVISIIYKRRAHVSPSVS